MVIEKLRQYRPKPSSAYHYNKSPGGRTPLGLGPAFSQKQHFKALSGALLEAAPPVSRGNSAVTTAGSSTTVEVYNADVEGHDRERTLVGSTTRRKERKTPPTRLSWFGVSKKEENNAPKHDGEIERTNGRKLVTPAVFAGSAGTSDSHPMKS